MRTIAWTAMLFAATLASECARAQQPEEEVAFRASVTATYSDNPARTVSGESATALDGLIGLRLAHQSPDFFADGDLSVIQRTYVEGAALPSETIPNGYLNLQIGPAAGPFNWTVADNFGQISTQPFAALVASDRQNVNILSTGPNLRIPFGSRDFLDLSGRYGLDTFGDTSLDQHSYFGQADLEHEIASGSRAGLVYSYQRIDFRVAQPSPADIEEGYAKYSLAGARTYVVLEAGVDELAEATLPSHSTAHVLALLQRHLTERLTFEAAYRHAYIDTGSAFVASTRDNFTSGTDQNVESLAIPFEESQGYAQLSRTAGRLLAAVQVTASREAYPSTPGSDRHTWGSNLSGDYQLSSRFTVNVRAGYWDEIFPSTQLEGHWLDASLGASCAFGHSLLLSLSVTRTKGTGNVLLNPFTENRALLQLAYSPEAQRLLRVYDTSAPFRYYDRPVQPLPH
jgi:hypothetical protein